MRVYFTTDLLGRDKNSKVNGAGGHLQSGGGHHRKANEARCPPLTSLEYIPCVSPRCAAKGGKKKERKKGTHHAINLIYLWRFSSQIKKRKSCVICEFHHFLLFNSCKAVKGSGPKSRADTRRMPFIKGSVDVLCTKAPALSLEHRPFSWPCSSPA